MIIEYQNKYVVTWCLDREGPRICLRAITKENGQKTVEITSDEFILGFEFEEARHFLDILSQLVGSTMGEEEEQPVILEAEPEIEEPLYSGSEPAIIKPTISEVKSEPEPEIEEPIYSEPEPAIIEPTISEVETEPEPEIEEPIYSEPEPEPEIEEPIYSEPEPAIIEPTISEGKSDTIESIFSEEELEIMEPIFSEDDSDFEKPVFPDVPKSDIDVTDFSDAPDAPEPDDSKIPSSSEIIQILKESEHTYSEISPEITEDTPIEELSKTPNYSKIAPTEIETASFFQKVQPKSPLELLLEEEKREDEVKVTENSTQDVEQEITEIPDSSEEPVPVYTPEDLHKESFFSRFKTKSTMDLLKEPEPESSVEIEPEQELVTELKRAVNLQPATKFVKKEPFQTEVERRAAIEKERAERRRRLWELTRGF